MKIAIYTLTRDRLFYTQECLRLLEENAGCEYDHFILDNGSTDGTSAWLVSRSRENVNLLMYPENIGISKASNICVREILRLGNYDLIVKMDNDCAMRKPGTLAAIATIYAIDPGSDLWVLSPRVVGINRQPRRATLRPIVGGREIGTTAIVGGLFHAVPATIYQRFMAYGGYDETLPLAWGQDDQFCEWLRVNRYHNGYVESLEVEHMETTDGQAKRYPDYFERKWKEEKERPA